MFKLRFYHKTGVNKGNCSHEEFFSTKQEMLKRYNEVFVYEDFALNPTLWEEVNGEWLRLSMENLG